MSERQGKSLTMALYIGLVMLAASLSGSVSKVAAQVDNGQCGENVVSCNVVEGYPGNIAANEITGATISGGGLRGSPNQTTGNYATVGGGEGNQAGEGSTVAGGAGNTASYFHASIGGGASNLASGQEATIAGGFKNTASARFATVGGGAVNTASGMSATAAGGSGNIANYRFTAVGGGTQNLASSTAAVVSGGDHNLAQGAYSSVAGGINNAADGYIAAVGGGGGNIASGSYAVTPGGFANLAGGDYSFAAGRGAQVDTDHPGAFLFADSSRFLFPSIAPNEFAARATGGVRFVTTVDSSGDPTSGVRLSPGSGAWESLSDYNAKAGFASVDEGHILEKLMSLPISTWYYRGQDPSIRHIGPTAQDFYAAFHLGRDDRYISTVDEDGVALAAIQELYRLVQEKDPATRRSEDLLQQQQIDSLERRLAFSNGLAAASLLVAALAWWRRAPNARFRL